MSGKNASDSALATARTQWQFGRWQALAAIEPDATVTGGERIEILLCQLEGVLQTGADPRVTIETLRQAGAPEADILRAIAASAFNSVGRSWLALGDGARAAHSLRRAVELFPERGAVDLVAGMRLPEQARSFGGVSLWRGQKQDGLFIDCGGYDGCSVLMFLMENPGYQCVTFEPNPALWNYYEGLPTELVGKAVSTFDGTVNLTIDPVDADGSSIHPAKKIDFHGRIANDECPVLAVECVDLSAYVRQAAARYGRIVLKLDVEGAEYDILERMCADGTISCIERLYCELHGEKLGIDRQRHEGLVERLTQHCPLEPWDARAYAIHGEATARAQRMRRELVQMIARRRAEWAH